VTQQTPHPSLMERSRRSFTAARARVERLREVSILRT
jgi:hypothetical protein